MKKQVSRRGFLRGAALAAAGAVAAACQPKTVIVTEEKEVTRVVKETIKETVIVEGTPQVVEKEVTKIVEKVVTPPPAPGAAEEEKSKSIVLAAHTDILSLDPHRIMEIWGSFVLNHCYDTLLALDPHKFHIILKTIYDILTLRGILLLTRLANQMTIQEGHRQVMLLDKQLMDDVPTIYANGMEVGKG